MLIGTKDGSIDQHWKVCMSFQYFTEASMLVYVQITNLLVHHGIDLKPGVGRILDKRQFHPLPGVGIFFCFGAGACSANFQTVMTGHTITKHNCTMMRV